MRAVQLLLIPTAPALRRRAAVVMPVLLLPVLLLPVLLLHLGLAWLLMHARPERADLNALPSSRPMALRWIESVPTAPSAEDQARPRGTPTQERSQAPRLTPRAITQVTPSATSQAPALEATVPPLAASAEIAPATDEPSRPTDAPLDLRLPRGTASLPHTKGPASLATRDSRANSERASVSEKLTEALGGDGRRTDENSGDGRIRIRSGADCVIAEESRAGQLDPMGQTTRPAPRGVKPCK